MNDKYEISSNGLTVYNPTFDDKGLYECKGIERQGDTKTRRINVDVVSKFSYQIYQRLQPEHDNSVLTALVFLSSSGNEHSTI